MEWKNKRKISKINEIEELINKLIESVRSLFLHK